MINILDLGAIGDGDPRHVDHNTRVIQGALDTGLPVYFPVAPESYRVNTLFPRDEQKLLGDGRYAKCLKGVGNEPVIVCENPRNRMVNRQHSLYGIRIKNDGAPCIVVRNSPNIHIEDCVFESDGSDALSLSHSFRATIRSCSINSSGTGYTAIKAVDNMNGLVIDGCVLTGGSRGRAVLVEQSQSVTVTNNIIESSLDGIWVASSEENGGGPCVGTILQGNYIEQCRTPFVIGTKYYVSGLQCSSNYIANANSTKISERTAVFNLGRILGGRIGDNDIRVLAARSHEDAVEDVFRFRSVGDRQPQVADVTIDGNYIWEYPRRVVNAYEGENHASIKRCKLGAFNFIDDGAWPRDRHHGQTRYSSPSTRGYLKTQTQCFL